MEEKKEKRKITNDCAFNEVMKCEVLGHSKPILVSGHVVPPY